jgi:hypothetical protein
VPTEEELEEAGGKADPRSELEKDTIVIDAQELRDFFVADGEGLAEEEAQKLTQKLVRKRTSSLSLDRRQRRHAR